MRNFTYIVLVIVLSSCARAEQEVIKDLACILSVRVLVVIALIWLIFVYLNKKIKL